MTQSLIDYHTFVEKYRVENPLLHTIYNPTLKKALKRGFASRHPPQDIIDRLQRLGGQRVAEAYNQEIQNVSSPYEMQMGYKPLIFGPDMRINAENIVDRLRDVMDVGVHAGRNMLFEEGKERKYKSLLEKGAQETGNFQAELGRFDYDNRFYIDSRQALPYVRTRFRRDSLQNLIKFLKSENEELARVYTGLTHQDINLGDDMVRLYQKLNNKIEGYEHQLGLLEEELGDMEVGGYNSSVLYPGAKNRAIELSPDVENQMKSMLKEQIDSLKLHTSELHGKKNRNEVIRSIDEDIDNLDRGIEIIDENYMNDIDEVVNTFEDYIDEKYGEYQSEREEMLHRYDEEIKDVHNAKLKEIEESRYAPGEHPPQRQETGFAFRGVDFNFGPTEIPQYKSITGPLLPTSSTSSFATAEEHISSSSSWEDILFSSESYDFSSSDDEYGQHFPGYNVHRE